MRWAYLILPAVLCCAACEHGEAITELPRQELRVQSNTNLEFGQAIDFSLTRIAPLTWQPAEWAPIQFEDAQLLLRSRRSWQQANLQYERLQLRMYIYAAESREWNFPWNAVNSESGQRITAKPASIALAPSSSLLNGQEASFEWLPAPIPSRSLGRRIAPALLFLALFAWLAQRQIYSNAQATPPRVPSVSLWAALIEWQRDVDRGKRDLAEVLRLSRQRLRALVAGQAWSGSQLVERVGAQHQLDGDEQAALARFVRAAEQREFATESARMTTQQQLDTAWDDLAIALRAIKEVRTP